MKDFKFDHTKIKRKAIKPEKISEPYKQPIKEVREAQPVKSSVIDIKPDVYKSKKRKSLKMDSEIGVYKIHCLPTDSVYIGQSKSIPKRFKTHMDNLKNGRYQTIYPALQNDYNQYGLDAFIFEVVEHVEDYELLQMETYYIQEHLKGGYNVYNNMLETENVGMAMCSNEYIDLIRKLIRLLESGKIRAEDIERGVYQAENL